MKSFFLSLMYLEIQIVVSLSYVYILMFTHVEKLFTLHAHLTTSPAFAIDKDQYQVAQNVQ